MNKYVIPFEEFQKLQELESVTAEPRQVAVPSGQLLPIVKLSLRFRKLGSSSPGGELITREDLAVRPEYAREAVRQITDAIVQAERLSSR